MCKEEEKKENSVACEDPYEQKTCLEMMLVLCEGLGQLTTGERKKS